MRLYEEIFRCRPRSQTPGRDDSAPGRTTSSKGAPDRSPHRDQHCRRNRGTTTAQIHGSPYCIRKVLCLADIDFQPYVEEAGPRRFQREA